MIRPGLSFFPEFCYTEEKQIEEKEMERKTVLITGASRGIGRAAALKFAREGYFVIINCREREDRLCEVKEEIERMGAGCLAVREDLSRADGPDKLWDAVEAAGLAVDVLVSNAGISLTGLLQDMTLEEWHRIMDTNVTPLFALSRRAIPGMLRRGHGKILATSSVYASAGGACEVAYSASKGAVSAFVRALAKELAPSNIQVNAIAPGAVDTEMVSEAGIGEEGYERLRDEIPTGRLAQPEEIAEAIYFMAEAPAYVTGEILTVDGGWM